jgi:3-(3-hydroxy-phenyl)propionate hydroxylase
MSTALALHARGVPVMILEADPEDRDRPGSRAIYVHGTTLRTLEQNHPGLGQRLVKEGLVWPTRRTLFRGKEVFSRVYPNSGEQDGIPHFTSLPQVRTEEFMLNACREADIEIHWDSPVDTVETSTDGVRVGTKGGKEWTAPYVVGADGAGSATRKEIDADFAGDESANSFIIADVEEDSDNPRKLERDFHYDHPELGGRNLLLVPFQGGWRVDLQCRESDDPERLAREDIASDWIGTALGDRYADRVSWTSSYQFLQVIADTFIGDHRRVLLAGEAAHLFAPFGARGMNSGIADADAAASAIAVAVNARSESVARSEIEAYAAQREKAGEWNKAAAGQALEYLQGDRLVTKAKKWTAAEVSDYWEPAGKWLDTAPYGPRSGPPIANGSKY